MNEEASLVFSIYYAAFRMYDIVVETDECATNPCQNGGSCSDEVNKFSCSCASGYEGATCHTGRLLFSTRRYHSHGRILYSQVYLGDSIGIYFGVFSVRIGQ